MDVKFLDIERAAKRIGTYLHNTPVVTSETLNEDSGLELYFKTENTQKTGSFKARGATNAVLAGMSLLPYECACLEHSKLCANNPFKLKPIYF